MARNCTHKVGFPSVATSPYGFKGNMQSCSREGRDSLIPFWILWTLGCVEGFSSFAYLMYSAKGGCSGRAPLCSVPFRKTSSVGLILFHKETPGLASL